MAKESAGRSTLSRHLQLLDAFDADSPYLTISELSRRSGLALATAHRLLAELEHNGLVERQADRTYRLGIRLWELACRTPGALGIRELASPSLHELHEAIRQHTQLGVLDGGDVVFLERLSMPDAVINVTLVGGRLPVHASASGLVLLAHAEAESQRAVLGSELRRFTENTITDASTLDQSLRRIRADGHVVAEGHIHPDARGIAVPVRGIHDEVVAAIGVVVPNDGTPSRPVIDRLLAASGQISTNLRSAYGPTRRPVLTTDARYRRALVRSGRPPAAG